MLPFLATNLAVMSELYFKFHHEKYCQIYNGASFCTDKNVFNFVMVLLDKNDSSTIA